ncbi:ATP-dependent DNA helicase MER3 [Neolecta irregularis DAH-3]|uniref:ATP-dependent DNA helicase MER3 n=1 Tax=Neolecta irregularis (strain DAH-3) TaxID=1198029 RepID=A0A1U7LIX9_NEOID|nr:ATP-dependent DNA helicase MER3 [Neolecta irregularis DAH-3]|eukprot:OLL22607.1 ATP-dependent DNA helicase MER3 [Neolecta irregularis DAH-3]
MGYYNGHESSYSPNPLSYYPHSHAHQDYQTSQSHLYPFNLQESPEYQWDAFDDQLLHEPEPVIATEPQPSPSNRATIQKHGLSKFRSNSNSSPPNQRRTLGIKYNMCSSPLSGRRTQPANNKKSALKRAYNKTQQRTRQLPLQERQYHGHQGQWPSKFEQSHSTPFAYRQHKDYLKSSYPKSTPDNPQVKHGSYYAKNEAAPVINGVHLQSIRLLPEKYQKVFSFPLFNAVQSACIPEVWYNSSNVVISSPTGSGKTVLFEIAICKLFNMSPTGCKIIYMAPTKALCNERVRDWSKKFGGLGGEMTGDTDAAQLSSVKESDIIITTPEKWDSMTRRWRDHRKLLDLVKLFLIDEVHMLSEKRGATLEVVVSRMQTLAKDIRIIALSATVPNIDDVALWIRKGNRELGPAIALRFGEEFRPVKLNKHVLGFCQKQSDNDFQFDRVLSFKLMSTIKTYSDNKPTIVFCSTRKASVDAAKQICKEYKEKSPKPWVQQGAITFKDKELSDVGKVGVGFHHAGLEQSDRQLLERSFLEGKIMVICCTSTLAVGINLPAHLVIVKNTLSYVGSRFEEYTDLAILQMMGRAGRPQFEDSGTGRDRDQQLETICRRDLDLLKEIKLVDEKNERLVSTVYGDAAARYYVRYETMKCIVNIKDKARPRDILEVLCKAEEFQELRPRTGEKSFYNEINKDNQIRYQLKGKVDSVADKMFILLQVCPHPDNSNFIGLGEVAVKTFVNHDIQNFEQLRNIDAQKIEYILKRNPPFGTTIVDALHSIPKFELQVQETSQFSDGFGPLQIGLKIKIGLANKTIQKRLNGQVLFADLLMETSDGCLLDFRRLAVFKLDGGVEFDLNVRLISSQVIITTVFCEDLVGTTVTNRFQPDVESHQFRQIAAKVVDVSNESDYEDAAFDAIAGDLEFGHLGELSFDHGVHSIEQGSRYTAETYNQDVSPDEELDRLPNGNYRCNHKCKNRNNCRHICCRDGTERPPKRSKAHISKVSQQVTRIKINDLDDFKNPCDRTARGVCDNKIIQDLKVIDTPQQSGPHQEVSHFKSQNWEDEICRDHYDSSVDTDMMNYAMTSMTEQDNSSGDHISKSFEDLFDQSPIRPARNSVTKLEHEILKTKEINQSPVGPQWKTKQTCTNIERESLSLEVSTITEQTTSPVLTQVSSQSLQKLAAGQGVRAAPVIYISPGPSNKKAPVSVEKELLDFLGDCVIFNEGKKWDEPVEESTAEPAKKKIRFAPLTSGSWFRSENF